MNTPYLDADTIAQCHLALRSGKSLDELAARLHLESEVLGRLLELPASQPVRRDNQPSHDLWANDGGVL